MAAEIPTLECVVHMLEGVTENADTVWEGHALCSSCVSEIDRSGAEDNFDRAFSATRQEVRRQRAWRERR